MLIFTWNKLWWDYEWITRFYILDYPNLLRLNSWLVSLEFISWMRYVILFSRTKCLVDSVNDSYKFRLFELTWYVENHQIKQLFDIFCGVLVVKDFIIFGKIFKLIPVLNKEKVCSFTITASFIHCL